MPKFRLVSGIYVPNENGEGGESHPQGGVIELSDEQAKGYLERGSIKPFDENETQEPEKKEVTGDVVEQFTLNDGVYKHVVNTEGDHFLLDGDEITQNAFENGRQVKVKEEEDERLRSEAPKQPEVQTTQETPLDPQNPQLNTFDQVTAQHQIDNQVTTTPVLTADQLAQDFNQTSTQQ